MSNWSRRDVLGCAAGTAVGAIAAPVLGQQRQKLQKVRLTTSWIPGTGGIYAVAAQQKGFWRQRGYDVEISRGYGSTAAIQAINQGHFDMGWSISTGAMIVQRSKGIHMQSVGQVLYQDTMAVVVLEGSPVQTPKDLEGKTLGVTQSSAEVPFIPVFAKNAGVDLSKVKVVNMNSDVRTRALMDKKIDAMTDSSISALPPLIPQGVALRIFSFSSYGLSLYSTAVVAPSKAINERPEMVQAIVDGGMEGVKWSMLNPNEALEIFLKEYPEMSLSKLSRENNRIGFGMSRAATLSTEVREHGIGYSDPKVIETMNDYVETYVTKSQAKPPTHELFTNRFAGKLRLSDAEWAKAKSLAAEYAKYLG